MKKKTIICLALSVILCLGLAACGGSQASSSSGAEAKPESAQETNSTEQETSEPQEKEGVSEENALFSAVGGWKADADIVFILDEDGKGFYLSEITYQGDSGTVQNLPKYVKQDVEWSEEDNIVSLSTPGIEGVNQFEKKTDNGIETLEINGIVYSRLDDEKVSEYKKIAEEMNASAGNNNGSEAEEVDPMVDVIDLAFDEGSIKYVGFEEANEGLTEADNALVFIFDFTNNQTKPSQCQSVFKIQFFQNGAELNSNSSYSSRGGDQYELVGAYFSEAMKGGTVTFGEIVIPKDDSPITIMVSRNGLGSANDTYQMMEVDISGDAEPEEEGDEDTSSEFSAEEIDEMLQGTWDLSGSEFYFGDGDISIDADGTILDGTYEVNLEDSCIEADFKTNDGKIVSIQLPYRIDDEGNLRLSNNRGVELEKK